MPGEGDAGLARVGGGSHKIRTGTRATLIFHLSARRSRGLRFLTPPGSGCFGCVGRVDLYVDIQLGPGRNATIFSTQPLNTGWYRLVAGEEIYPGFIVFLVMATTSWDGAFGFRFQ